MNHDKIKEVLNALSACCVEDCDMATTTERAIDEAMDLIRSLRTECDNQATRIVDLEQAAAANSEPVAWDICKPIYRFEYADGSAFEVMADNRLFLT